MDDLTHRLLTLGLALEWLKSAHLESTQERDLRSAVNNACQWFGRSADDVPADPVVLRRLFRKLSPAKAGKRGVTKKTFANVKSAVGRLMALMGVGSRGTHRHPLSPAWAVLTALIDDPFDGPLLRRFGRYCSAREIEPATVCDAIAGGFLCSLESELRIKDPRRVHRATVQLWNRFARSLPSWPQIHLTVPDYSRKYVLDWDTFHPDLVNNVEDYLQKQSTDDPFDLSAPVQQLKPSTINTYRDRLRRFASCAVLSGVDPALLRSLQDLVQLETVVRGLRYLAYDRASKPLAATTAILLLQIARDHLHRPEDEITAIDTIARKLRAKRKGLSSKTRELLRPLKHEPNLARLFLFPTALTRTLMRLKVIRRRDALLFQRALALAILTVCPLRIGSLCSVRIDRHLHWSNGPMQGDLTVEFSEGELKGGEPASFPIPREVANLIRTYCERFRPHLDPQGSSFLFCGQDPNRPKTKECFSMQLRKLIFEGLGFWVYPHLYRHIVHLVVLRRFPGAYALIARVLTHRSISTTIKNYSHFDAELAMRVYQRTVEGAKAPGPLEHASHAAVVAYALDREHPTHDRS